MSHGLDGQTAIITGASSGIGAATARALAGAGAAVVLAARRRDRLERLAAELAEAGASTLAIPTDVAERDQVDALAAGTLDRFGRIDILVNNAGVMHLSEIRALRVDEWHRMVDVNVKGAMSCVAAVLPTMLDQGSGHIVNVSSIAGRRPFKTGSIYSATKFALRSLSQGLRLELSPDDGIRVTDIEPGAVDTELLDHIHDDDARQAFHDRWSDRRMLQAEDVAAAVLYAVTQPDRVSVNEVLVRPTDQRT